jgi:hypothetical protein
LKQKDHHSNEELAILDKENYYKNIMKQVYNKDPKIQSVNAYPVFDTVIVGENNVMIRCNHDKNVYLRIITGKKYVIEMPNINTILNVTCTFAAFRAADMYIDIAHVNGERDHGSETCTISYNYDMFDSIYYSSFKAPDACIIYSY